MSKNPYYACPACGRDHLKGEFCPNPTTPVPLPTSVDERQVEALERIAEALEVMNKTLIPPSAERCALCHGAGYVENFIGPPVDYYDNKTDST